MRGIGAAAGVVLAAGVAGKAAADIGEQELRLLFRQGAETTDLAAGFQAFTVFAATPGISAAWFTATEDDDDTRLASWKLAPSWTFDPVLPYLRPYVEGTLGYLSSDSRASLTVSADGPTDIDIHTDTFAALAGAGLALATGPHTTLRPILQLGYARTTDDGDLSGPDARLIEEAGKGILFDVEVNSALAGGALALDHDRPLPHGLRLRAGTRYTWLVARNFAVSDESLEGTEDFGVLTGSLRLDGPVPWRPLGRDLRWLAFAAGTYIPAARDAVGFSSFAEVGGGIELVERGLVAGVDGLSLRVSAILGDDVHGWSAGLALEF